jgi:hypothetical protein
MVSQELTISSIFSSAIILSVVSVGLHDPTNEAVPQCRLCFTNLDRSQVLFPAALHRQHVYYSLQVPTIGNKLEILALSDCRWDDGSEGTRTCGANILSSNMEVIRKREVRSRRRQARPAATSSIESSIISSSSPANHPLTAETHPQAAAHMFGTVCSDSDHESPKTLHISSKNHKKDTCWRWLTWLITRAITAWVESPALLAIGWNSIVQWLDSELRRMFVSWPGGWCTLWILVVTW